MKKLLLIIFVLVQFICRAEYDSTYVLSITQKYAIPENVVNGDYVGIWKKTYTWVPVGAISYMMEQNYNNAFSIDSSTGLITISNASQINGQVTQQDMLINLIIRTTDSNGGNDVYELDTARIWVKENAYCKFIDYAAPPGTETGTRTQPYNDLDDIVTKTPGYGYFIKRGVRFPQGTTRIKGHIASASHPTIFGAYGTGDLPTFDGTGQSYCFYFGDNNYPDTDKVEHVKFYDLAIKKYPNCAWRLLRKSSFCGWYNCVSDSNAFLYSEAQLIINTSNYIDSINYLPNEIINCTFNRTIDDPAVEENSSLIKCGNGPLTTINCYFSNSIHASWRATCGMGSSLKHSIIVNSGIKAIQIRDSNTTIEDVRIINSGQNAIEITGNTTGNYYMPKNTIIRNCYIEQGGSEASVIVREPSSTFLVSQNTTIDDCLIENGVIGIQSNDSYNMQIRRNKISGFSSYPIWIYTNYSNKVFNPAISYNAIYNSGVLRVEDGVGATVYNNTVDGNITLSGTSGSIVRNNFFKDLVEGSTPTKSNNLDIDAISTGNYFTNYAGHDYSLKSTASLAINLGYNVSLTQDIQGTTVGNPPDIGAYEYVPGGGTPVVTITATDASAAETSQNTGTFSIIRTGATTAALSVNYSKTGTTTSGDYTQTLSGSVTIPIGSATATITITPVDDAKYEDDETVILTLGTGTGYTVGSPSSDTVTIADDEPGPAAEEFYTLNEASGQAIDSQGNNNSTAVSATQNQTGKIGTCYLFNGTSNKITFGDSNNWSVNTTDNFSGSAWINFTADLGATWGTVWGNAANISFGVKKISAGNYALYWYAGGAVSQSTTFAMTAGVWYHIAIVKTSNTSVRFYLNNALRNTVTPSDINVNPPAVYIGGNENTNEYFKGKIDALGIWKSVLTSTDVSALYNSTKSAFIPKEESAGSSALVYPNPFGDVLRVSNAEDVARAELINMSGETLIVKQNPQAPEMRIDTKKLKSGVYILRLFDNTGAVSVFKVAK